MEPVMVRKDKRIRMTKWNKSGEVFVCMCLCVCVFLCMCVCVRLLALVRLYRNAVVLNMLRRVPWWDALAFASTAVSGTTCSRMANVCLSFFI